MEYKVSIILNFICNGSHLLAIPTLLLLELQPCIVREVQRRLRLGGSRFIVTCG